METNKGMLCPKCSADMLCAYGFFLWSTTPREVAVIVCSNPNCLEALAVEKESVCGENNMFVIKAMVKHEMCGSIKEARQIIRQKGVWVNSRLVIKPTQRLNKGDVIRVGKTRVEIFDPVAGE